MVPFVFAQTPMPEFLISIEIIDISLPTRFGRVFGGQFFSRFFGKDGSEEVGVV